MPPKPITLKSLLEKKPQKKRKLSTESEPKVQKKTSSSTQPSKKRIMMSQHILSKGVLREDLDARDIELLMENEFGRYAFSNSSRIGHAVIKTDEKGQLSATQYALPQPVSSDDMDVPEICPLTDIQKRTRGPYSFYSAKGPGGKSFFARRTLKQVDASNHEMEIAYFSESEDFDEAVEANSAGHFESIKGEHITIKGGREITLDVASIAAREQQTSRGKSQNQVMKKDGKGWSARDEYEDYFKKNRDKFSPELQAVFQNAFTADVHSHSGSQRRPEWLHLCGFSVFPLSGDPQQRDNLGAAAKWVNTEMMILERIGKWFAVAFADQAQVKIKPLFEMLTGSDIAGKINFEVSLEYRDFFIRFIQELYPLQESPVFHKPSDLAQTVAITHAQLKGHAPLVVENITCTEEPYVPRVWQDVPQSLPQKISERSDIQVLSFLDLETTNLDYRTGKIIEIGIISVYFHVDEGILGVKCQYSGLADPHENLSEKIVEVTGLTDTMLAGQSIDWEHIREILHETNYVICHNSAFDRKFLESATPDFIQERIRQLPFGCTLEGIHWERKGFLSKKLIDLNAQLKFKYTGHRALNDCWATINLLNQVPGVLNELMINTNQEKTLICVTDTDYLQSPSLRAKHFSFSKGEDGLLPQCWYKYVDPEELPRLKRWLDRIIYQEEGKSDTLIQIPNTRAIDRYSVRVRLQEHFTSSVGFFAVNNSTQAEMAAVTENCSFTRAPTPRQ